MRLLFGDIPNSYEYTLIVASQANKHSHFCEFTSQNIQIIQQKLEKFNANMFLLSKSQLQGGAPPVISWFTNHR